MTIQYDCLQPKQERKEPASGKSILMLVVFYVYTERKRW